MKIREQTQSKNLESAWRDIFSDLSINSIIKTKGFYDIESRVIKRYYEPRIACKIDFREKTPKVLSEHELSLLAIENGVYRIAKTDPFIDINITNRIDNSEKLQPKSFYLPDHIEALSPSYITSESKALDAALTSKMLDYVFQDEVDLILRGRERTTSFDFSLPTSRNQFLSYQVDSVQIEVDGGYEGKKGIYLIEAKNELHDNMNIRQLLYPQLHYRQKFSTSKSITTYIMFYEPETRYFHFFPFRYSPNWYGIDNSQYQCCMLYEPEETEELPSWRELKSVQVNPELTDIKVPFPQADNFHKILTLFCDLRQEGPLTKEELFQNHSIVARQYDYYLNALRWMRLVEVEKGGRGTSRSYRLSDLGSRLGKYSDTDIVFEMAKIVFSNDLFNKYLNSENPYIPHSIRIRNRLETKSTFERRTRTIVSWKKYFRRLFDN